MVCFTQIKGQRILGPWIYSQLVNMLGKLCSLFVCRNLTALHMGLNQILLVYQEDSQANEAKLSRNRCSTNENHPIRFLTIRSQTVQALNANCAVPFWDERFQVNISQSTTPGYLEFFPII